MKSLFKLIIGLFMVHFVTIVHAQTFTNYTTADGLPSNNVNGVAIDHNNNKWFGTQMGVAKFNDATWTVYTKTDGLIDNYINCIAVDSSGNIWAGTDFGLSKFDGVRWISYTVDSGLVNNTITYIAADPDGSVWFGTNSGLSHLAGSVWKSYDSLPGDHNNVSYISFDSGGNKWIGTWIGGLVKFNGSAFTPVTNDSILSNSITSVAIDQNNNKWLGTYYGITVLDNNNQWIKNYRHIDGLYNNYVQDIHMDSKDNIWVGMYADYVQDGGITKFDGTTWTSYTVTDGLVDKLVRRLTVDHKDNIWITTGNGVSKFTDKNSGISDISVSGVKIFPDPASDLLTVSQVLHPMVLTFSDITGRKRMTQNLPDNSNNINISGLNPGMYILKLSEGSKIYTSKLIVQ